MQDLLHVRAKIDAVSSNIETLKRNQKVFDSPGFQPDDINLSKSVVPASISEAVEFVHAIQRQEEDVDATNLINMIGRARIALYIVQAQIELALWQHREEGLNSCTVKDEDSLWSIFSGARKLKEELVRQQKLPTPYKDHVNGLLGSLNQSIQQIDVPSEDLTEIASEDLISSIFLLRLRFVESCVSAIELQSTKIQIAQQRIATVVKMMENDLIPQSDFAWSAIEDDRKFARTALASCDEKVRQVEGYMVELYKMGQGFPSQPDFKIVRYAAAPLDLLGPT